MISIEDFNPDRFEPFPSVEAQDAFLYEFALAIRLKEGRREVAGLHDLIELVGGQDLLHSPEAFNAFLKSPVFSPEGVFQQVVQRLLHSIGTRANGMRLQRSARAYLFSVIQARFNPPTHNEWGDDRDPIVTACVDLITFQFLKYCRFKAEARDNQRVHARTKEKRWVRENAPELEEPLRRIDEEVDSLSAQKWKLEDALYGWRNRPNAAGVYERTEARPKVKTMELRELDKKIAALQVQRDALLSEYLDQSQSEK